jgi:hypothetical protein
MISSADKSAATKDKAKRTCRIIAKKLIAHARNVAFANANIFSSF